MQTIKKIFRFLGQKTALSLLLGAVIGLCLFGVELAFAYALQAFLVVIGVLSSQSAQIPSLIPHSGVFATMVFIATVGITRGLLQWLQIYLSGAALESHNVLQRSRLVDWAFHSESVNSGEVTTLFNHGTRASGMAVQHLQTLTVLLPTSLLLWCGLFYLAPVPTLSATAVLGVLAIPMRRFDRAISNAGVRAGAEMQLVNNQLFRNIKNLLLMQIYGTQSREAAGVRSGLRLQYAADITYLRLSGLKFVVPQIAGVMLICFITLTSLKTGSLAPSVLLMYFYLFVRFVQAFSETLKNAASLGFYWPQVARLAKWWADHAYDGVRGEKRQLTDTLPDPLPEPPGWQLRGVGFSYGNTNLPVLADLNLIIKPGEAIVFSGESGAGKSTLLYLLLGNLVPTLGQITIVAKNGKQRPLEELRPRLLQSVGYVGPESFLVEGTILQNLTYGLRESPSKAQIEQAIVKAECQFVNAMPRGLEHPLTEQGQGLSAGQKQRLSLARALLRNPKVLILDEATANLDADTELKLVATLAQLKGQMTIIAATHRQALLQIADQHLRLNGAHSLTTQYEPSSRPLSL